MAQDGSRSLSQRRLTDCDGPAASTGGPGPEMPPERSSRLDPARAGAGRDQCLCRNRKRASVCWLRRANSGVACSHPRRVAYARRSGSGGPPRPPLPTSKDANPQAPPDRFTGEGGVGVSTASCTSVSVALAAGGLSRVSRLVASQLLLRTGLRRPGTSLFESLQPAGSLASRRLGTPPENVGHAGPVLLVRRGLLYRRGQGEACRAAPTAPTLVDQS